MDHGQWFVRWRLTIPWIFQISIFSRSTSGVILLRNLIYYLEFELTTKTVKLLKRNLLLNWVKLLLVIISNVYLNHGSNFSSKVVESLNWIKLDGSKQYLNRYSFIVKIYLMGSLWIYIILYTFQSGYKPYFKFSDNI